MDAKEKIAKYPKTDLFEVADTMGVPHPFCITHHHVAWASDHHSGMLGREAIEAYERMTNRPSCGVTRCNLMYSGHEQALAVRCKTKDEQLTRVYLQSIAKQCEDDGFAGFVLIDAVSELDKEE